MILWQKYQWFIKYQRYIVNGNARPELGLKETSQYPSGWLFVFFDSHGVGKKTVWLALGLTDLWLHNILYKERIFITGTAFAFLSKPDICNNPANRHPFMQQVSYINSVTHAIYNLVFCSYTTSIPNWAGL